MNFLDFMQPTGPVACSQQPATGLSRPHIHARRIFLSFFSVLFNKAVRCDNMGLVAGEWVWSRGEMIPTN